jgi:hypothetical protein
VEINSSLFFTPHKQIIDLHTSTYRFQVFIITHIYFSMTNIHYKTRIHVDNSFLTSNFSLVSFINVNVVDSDDVIGEGSVELSTVGGPGEGGGGIDIGSVLGDLILGSLFNDELGNRIIGVTVQVEDVNTVFTGGSNPLLDGVEGNLVDGGTSVEGSVFFGQIVEVPDLKGVFLTTSGDVGTEGSNGEGVNVFVVGLEGVLDEEVRLPDLKSTIPTDGGEVGVLGDGGVSDAGNPIRVVVGFVGVLAISEGVPELEGSVSTSRDDLSVIKGEGNGVDFLGVANEDSGGLTGSQVPKSEGLVPRGGKTEEVVSGEGNIGDEVVVTSEGLKGDTVKSVGVRLIDFFGSSSQFPDHKGLISGTGNKDGGFFVFLEGVASGNASNPVSVTFEVTN